MGESSRFRGVWLKFRKVGMHMKKVMNDPAAFVDESLQGIIAAHGDQLKFAGDDTRAVIRKEAPVEGKVAIVTGGGYGHLPTFLGFVGQGFCDGVAVGNVFTSPSSDAILNAARAVDGGKGILFLFGNYMGDTMNFEMASEMLQFEDIPCQIIKGSDDVASGPRSDWENRRGVAGIFFAYKIAGAMADTGASLEEVCEVTRRACERIATMGVAFSSCQLPGAAAPIFEIGDDEMEIGMGIHGEPGVERGKMRTSAEIAQVLVEKVTGDLSLGAGSEVALLVNGLGATSREELYILYNDVKKIMDEKGIAIKRVFVEEFATSLEMQGASLTAFALDEQLEELLNKPGRTPFVCV